MKTKSFSKKEALQFGWETTKNNLGFFIDFLIISIILIVVSGIIAIITIENNIFLGVIFHLVYYILILIISMGWAKIALMFCDNEKGSFKELFSQYPLFFKYLAGFIIYTLILYGGLILLIIPGIIWMVKSLFLSYFIIDKKLGPIKALKKSFVITKGHGWNLFIFLLITFGINLLGVLVLLVGLLITLPMTTIATAFVYRKLSTQLEATPTPEVLT